MSTLISRRSAICCALYLCLISPVVASAQSEERVSIDAHGAATPFPHFWEEMFGSGRANLTLRESYREDLHAVKSVTDLKYVRFHAILHDENGVYNEDEHGNPVYNFAYVDQIYDGLIKNGVKPVVEISFMPKKLAFNPDALHPFWYKQNVSPPKSMERWDGLISHFAQHLVERYGIDEVAQWYFEVWNEPNIDFWNGIPRQESYFDLYAHTARALKAVNPRLRVGGPATAAAEWVPEFLKYMADNHVPVDFVSSHGYADDTVANLFHTNEEISMDDRVCRAIGKVKDQIRASTMPQLPLFWTEWNVQGERNSRDTLFVGPGLANTVRECDGLAEMMSFWTFSDVFEEGGPIPQPFEGEFGLRASGGINKPSFYDFALLHQLGDRRIASSSKNVIATKRADGSLVIAAWNIVDPSSVPQLPDGPHGATNAKAGTEGPTRTLELDVTGVVADAAVSISRVDDTHGNVLPRYYAMGAPQNPTPAQVAQLNRETALPAPEETHLKAGHLTLRLTPNALVLVTVRL